MRNFLLWAVALVLLQLPEPVHADTEVWTTMLCFER